MVLRFLVGLFAVVAALSVAEAQDTVCTSITQRDCAPLPRVMVKGNLRVEIVTQKRELSFVPDPDDEPCFGGGKCVCGEVIEHLDFKGPVPGFAGVNAAELRAAAAAAAKCSVENSTVTRRVEHYLVSPRFVSIAAFELEYCHSCGGSCHGTTVLATYEATSGRALRVGDVVRADQVEALRRFMADDFAAKNFDDQDRAPRKKLLVEELARRPLKDAGIYVENGTVFVDLDSFAMGCADGSFHPIAVPVAFLAPAFAAQL